MIPTHYIVLKNRNMNTATSDVSQLPTDICINMSYLSLMLDRTLPHDKDDTFASPGGCRLGIIFSRISNW